MRCALCRLSWPQIGYHVELELRCFLSFKAFLSNRECWRHRTVLRTTTSPKGRTQRKDLFPVFLGYLAFFSVTVLSLSLADWRVWAQLQGITATSSDRIPYGRLPGTPQGRSVSLHVRSLMMWTNQYCLFPSVKRRVVCQPISFSALILWYGSNAQLCVSLAPELHNRCRQVKLHRATQVWTCTSISRQYHFTEGLVLSQSNRSFSAETYSNFKLDPHVKIHPRPFFTRIFKRGNST